MLSNSIYSMLPKYKFIYEERNVELPNYLNREIKDNWNELINSGKKYTNGELYTISSIKFENDNCLIFRILKTDYAHYLYTVKQDFQGEYICRSIATSALFITNDNYYVLGKMSSDTSLPGNIKFIGGAISKEDFIENELHPIEGIKREVKEEIGLDLDDKSKVESVNSSYFITIKNLSFINICFKIKLNLSSKEIIKLFDEHNENLYNQNMEQELDSIVLVKNDRENLNNFFTDNKGITMDYLEELFLVEMGINEARNFSDEDNLR